MTDFEKLKRIELYESFNYSEDEIQERLEMDIRNEGKEWWELIHDNKFYKVKDLPSDDSFPEDNYNDLTESSKNQSKKSKQQINKIEPGNIVIINSFTDNDGVVVDNRTHRMVVIGIDEKNNVYNNKYIGFKFSSQIQKANINNKNFPKNIYINDYNTIYSHGEHSDTKEVCLNLLEPIEVSYDEISSVVGQASPKFMNFLTDTLKMIRNKEDTSQVQWVQ